MPPFPFPSGFPPLGRPRPAGRRSRLVLTAKLAVTAGVLGVLLEQADWERLADRLAHASPALLALGFVAKTMTIPFAAERWRMIGRVAGVRLSPGLSLRLVMASVFFGQVLPGALGADIVRGWLTWRSGQAPGAVAAALVLDRLAGLAGLLALVLAGLPHLLAVVPLSLAVALPAGAAAAAAGIALLAQLDRLPWPARWRRPAARLLSLVAGLRGALTHRGTLAALGHSVAVHLCTIAATLLFAAALSVPVRPLDALAVMPLAIMAAALPISLAGWGVREGSMVAGFALFGVAGEDALLVALLVGLSGTLMALPGGLAWLSLPAPPPGPDGAAG